MTSLPNYTVQIFFIQTNQAEELSIMFKRRDSDRAVHHSNVLRAPFEGGSTTATAKHKLFKSLGAHKTTTPRAQ